jgi:ribosomal protein S18 acetylase RimI-like enzyme
MWRLARPDEDAAIVALSLALYEEDPAPEPVSTDHVERTLRALRDDPVRGRAVVLELGGRVSGYALLISFWSNELGGEVCTVDEIYVAAALRSRGHGAALVEALARGDGPWPGKPVALELEVSPENTRARALYERLGFRSRRNATLRRLLRR